MKHIRFIPILIAVAVVLSIISTESQAQVAGSLDLVTLAERYLPFLVIAIVCALVYHVVRCDRRAEERVAERRRMHKRINRIDRLQYLICGQLGVKIPTELLEDDEDE